MSVQHYVSFAVGLTASFSLMACDSPSRPLEATAQQLPSAEPASDGLAAARATPERHSLNGPHAMLQASSGQGDVYREVYLDLYAVTTDEAHLYYGIWECDRTTFDCVSIETGDGPLYGDEVSTSRGRITVNINTAENPAFSLWDGSGGPINITWTELSGWSSESTIQTRYRQSDYSSHSHGTYTSTSALAEGTVLGVQLEPGSSIAQMGTVKDGGITIMREP
jgi:hypothetical protein